jgi:hypothetical protein
MQARVFAVRAIARTWSWSVLIVCAAQASAFAQVTHTVPAGGDFQAALNRAEPGDTITLEPGATYVGNFVLPAKTGDRVITIRTAAPDAALPADGERITPAAAPLLPKLRSANTQSVLRTAAGAHHYRLLFLEFVVNVQGASTILALGDGSSQQNTLAAVPYALDVDRVIIRGDAVFGAKRGIGLNSASTRIVNSYIADIKAVGQDSQAIGGWNGPGPYVIHNNYLEAAGENVMFGGADPAIANLVPSDITFTRNHVAKPLAWRDSSWTIKNLFELKSAQRVRIDGNLFENNWAAAQTGSAILLKSVNQDGNAPWSVVQNVEFTNNIVRNVSSGVNILGRDLRYAAIELNNVLVRNNLFANISGAAFGGVGRLLLINGGSQIVFDHNTAINDGATTISADGAMVQGFVLTNNVMLDNSWAIKGSGAAEGTGTLNTFFPGSVVTGNVIVNANGAEYPAMNAYPSLAQVGFVNYGGGDYRIGVTSAYKASAPDGTDPGVNFDQLAVATNSAYAPIGPPPIAAPPVSAAPPPAPPASAPPHVASPVPSPASGGSASSASAPISAAENTHTPHGVTATVNGTTVLLSWLPPVGTSVLQYLVEAGSAPGTANIARLLTPPTPSLLAQQVPHGAYFVRVRAVTATGTGDPSSDASFVVGNSVSCGTTPAAPANLRATVVERVVQLTWEAPPGGCAASHFIVVAGSAPGLSDLAQLTMGGAVLVTPAPPGTYYVRVMAANASGASGSSNEIVVFVP